MAVLALAALALGLAPRRPWGSADCAYGEATYEEAGEGLLHAVELGSQPLAYHMPLSSVATACLRGHSGPAGRRAWLTAVRAGPALLAGAAGVLAGSAAAGAAAAAVLAWGGADPPCHPQGLLCLFVLAVAGVLLCWARRPTLGRSWALAAAVGAALVLRSTLAFFPPLLAVWALHRGARRAALVVGLAPYLALVPWTAANLALHGRVVPLEMGQAGSNVVAGALGLVGTVEGDLDALAPDAPDAREGGAVLVWAGRKTLSHPRRTLDAVVARILFAVRLAPALWAAALIGFFSARRRPEARALGLLAGYLLGVHVLMAVQANYFIPFEAVLTLLATAPLWGRRYGLGRGAEFVLRLLSGTVVGVFIAAGAAAAAAASGLALRHAWLARSRPPDSAAALEAALAASPSDGVLRLARGRRRLSAGELGGAELDFGAAASAGVARARPLAAWAGALEGRATALAGLNGEGLSCSERALLKLFRAEFSGAEAGRAAAEALRLRAGCAFARGPDRGADRLLRGDAPALKLLLGDLAAARPRGRLLTAPPLLAGALQEPVADPGAWHALALGLQDLEDYGGSLSAYDRLLAAAPPTPGLLSDRGVALALAGRTGEAKAALGAALAADPGFAPAALTLGAMLEGEGNRGGAKTVYESALGSAKGGGLRGVLLKRLARLR